MIQSEEGYGHVSQQLGLVERALADLRREVLPKSEARYRLMAEPYEDQAEKLRAELHAWRRRKVATRPDFVQAVPTERGVARADDGTLVSQTK